MELKVKDLVSTIDLNKGEVLLPLYESVVNSILGNKGTGSCFKKD